MDVYTPDQAASILKLHPKTVRRFIREGKIKAHKIGKNWRITEKNLNKFLTGDSTNSAISTDADSDTASANPKVFIDSPGKESNSHYGKIEVSSVIDIYVNNQDEANRLSNSVIALLNSKDGSYGKTRCDFMYYNDERKARFIIWGSPRFVRELLTVLEMISKG